MKSTFFDAIIVFFFLGMTFFGVSSWMQFDKLHSRIQQQNEYIKRLQQEANDSQVEIDNLRYNFEMCKLLYKGM